MMILKCESHFFVYLFCSFFCSTQGYAGMHDMQTNDNFFIVQRISKFYTLYSIKERLLYMNIPTQTTT